MEFRPRRLTVHVDRHTASLEITRREHTAHYVLKDMLLNSIEAVLFAERIDKR